MKKIVIERCLGDFLNRIQNTQNHGPHRIGANVFHLEILDAKKKLYIVYKNGVPTQHTIKEEYSNLLKHSNFIYVEYQCRFDGSICDYYPAQYEYWSEC